MTRTNIIVIKNACKSYESHAVLADFNMTVEQGTIYALMGSSGCGKTTLLSCVVGMKSLDSGSITVLNGPVGRNKSRIGFMPQEVAIIEDFSIKELIYFFATIYGMNKKQIRDRFKFLSNLLELPFGDELLKNCSGGQRRRVSLAICLIHQPKLLILDEPSVGLDPLLRNKIWGFFETITKAGEATIVITTHYIEEARKANCVGLLRKGEMIAETLPANLLARFNTDSLETVFLKICEKQEKAVMGKTDAEWNEDNRLFEATATTKCLQETRELEAVELLSGKDILAKFLKLKALVTKNFLQIIRRPAALGFLLITPFLCLVSFYLTIGSDPTGLKIGIVNGEVKHHSECLDPLLKMTTVDDSSCRVNKVSCRFINSLNESVATKVYFDNVDDALHQVRKGILIGLIYFSANFTSLFQPLSEWQNIFEIYTTDLSTDGQIQIYLDQADRQITGFIKQRLYETYEDFVENLMVSCGRSRKVGNMPMQTFAMFGSLKDESRRSMTPGIIITVYFFLASMLSSTTFVSDRLDGIWNRVLLAGVEPAEMLASHIVSNSVVMFLQAIELAIVTTFVYKMDNQGDNLTVILLMLLVGLAAISYGLAVSILANDYMTATFASSLIFYPMMIFCGIFWPLEAIPWIFRYTAYCLPFTLPTVALRNILYKGFTIMNPSVQIGFAVVILWLLLSLLVCFVGLKLRKFCS